MTVRVSNRHLKRTYSCFDSWRQVLFLGIEEGKIPFFFTCAAVKAFRWYGRGKRRYRNSASSLYCSVTWVNTGQAAAQSVHARSKNTSTYRYLETAHAGVNFSKVHEWLLVIEGICAALSKSAFERFMWRLPCSVLKPILPSYEWNLPK